VHHT